MGHYDAITINTDDISTTHHGSEVPHPHFPVRMKQEPSTKGLPKKKKKDRGLFFFEMGSGHGLSTYVSRHLSIYGNGTSISE